jgi:hypothetical protein
MNEDTLMLVIVFSFAGAFAIGFFFIIYKLVKVFGGAMTGKSSSFQPYWTKEQLNMVATLTEDEQRSMRRGTVIGLIVVTIICGVGITSISATYWKYVVQGEKISATVIDVDSYRSGSRREYIYSLEATVGGERVRDTYRSGMYHDAEIGDVVDVYAAPDADPELVLAAVEERDPLWLLFFFTFFTVFVSAVLRQRKRIATGQMKIARLPKAMKRKKLMELKQQKTPEGKPMYTIGGSSQAMNEGDDGRNYRVS